MSFKVKIKDVLEYTKSTEEEKILKAILTEMSQRVNDGLDDLLKSNYSSYVDFLDFSLSKNRKLVGKALLRLWDYCHDQEIPPLNFLVVRKDDDLPGEGVLDWYVNIFGALDGYEVYCKTQAELCSFMLSHGIIKIV